MAVYFTLDELRRRMLRLRTSDWSVACTMKLPWLAVRRAGRPDTSAADVSRSLMYSGE